MDNRTYGQIEQNSMDNRKYGQIEQNSKTSYKWGVNGLDHKFLNLI